jgi:hypothetical protein
VVKDYRLTGYTRKLVTVNCHSLVTMTLSTMHFSCLGPFQLMGVLR